VRGHISLFAIVAVIVAGSAKAAAVGVHMSASDIFANLPSGAEGLIIARKGEWGFGRT
jgi:hypothetical protein